MPCKSARSVSRFTFPRAICRRPRPTSPRRSTRTSSDTCSALAVTSRASFKLRVQDVENHLAQRKATVEADLQARKEEFQRWCQEQERVYQDRMRAVPAAPPPPAGDRERLAIRARELDHLAQHLQRQR